MKAIIKEGEKSGFTLIEMIGVIAILSILFSLLIPKIFDAIEDSKIDVILKTYDTVKSAVATHIAKNNGKIVDRNGNLITYSRTVDSELVAQGFLSGRIADKIGIGSTNPLYTWLGIGVIDGQLTQWDFNGDGVIDLKDDSDRIVKIKIGSLPRKIAWQVSKRIDGETLSATDINSADTKGSVIYGASHGSGDVITEVFIYIYNF
ncbi:MAG: type II secretion system protein [Verrucomicrobiia bacterium]